MCVSGEQTNLVSGWLVVLGFNATLTAKVISFSFHLLLFSHASSEVRGENTPERKVPSTGDQTRNHQVMSPTSSPLSHPGGATLFLIPHPLTHHAKALKLGCLTDKFHCTAYRYNKVQTRFTQTKGICK